MDAEGLKGSGAKVRTRAEFLRDGALAAAAVGALAATSGFGPSEARAQTAPAYPPGALEDPTPNNGDFEYALPINPYSAGNEARVVDLVARAKAVGANGITVGVAWDYLQPTQDATPNFYPINVVLREARARGMKMSLQITGVPLWAHPWVEGVEPDPNYRRWYPPMEERELGLWSRFVETVAAEYGTQAARYTIWNEPNVPQIWRGTPGDHTYVELLRASYDAIKRAAGPEGRVAFGGLSRNDVAYLQRFYDAAKRYPDAVEKRFYFDEMDVHPYIRGGFSPDIRTPPDDVYSTGPRGLPATKAVMDRNGDAGKPMFLGEFGYTTGGNSWFTGSADYRRAAFLKQGLFRARQLPYVRGMSWFAFHPSPGVTADWTMLREDLAESRTLQAFKEATGVFPSTKVYPKRPADGVVRGVYPFYPVFSAKLDPARTQFFELYVNGRYAARSATAPVRWDTRTKKNGAYEFVLVAYLKGTADFPWGRAYLSQPVVMTVRN